MSIKRFAMMVLVILLTFGLLAACDYIKPGMEDEAREAFGKTAEEEKEEMEFEEWISGIEEEEEKQEEKEQKEEEKQEEKVSQVDIESIMKDMWVFEVPMLSEFGEPQTIHVDRSYDGNLDRTTVVFWYGPEETAKGLLELYGMPILGYIPEEMYTVDAPAAQAKEGMQVEDVGLSVHESADGFNVSVSIRHEQTHPQIMEFFNEYWPIVLNNEELLPDDKKIFDGMSYCYDKDILELYTMWSVNKEELDKVVDWGAGEFGGNTGFKIIEDGDMGSTELKFEVSVGENEEQEASGTAYYNFEMWEFRTIIPF